MPAVNAVPEARINEYIYMVTGCLPDIFGDYVHTGFEDKADKDGMDFDGRNTWDN